MTFTHYPKKLLTVFSLCWLLLFYSASAFAQAHSQQAPKTSQSELTLETQETQQTAPHKKANANDTTSIAQAPLSRSQELALFEDEYNTLEQRIQTNSRNIEDYEEFYRRLRPVLFEKTEALQQKMASSEVNLSLLMQINNPKQLQHFLYEYTELKNYFAIRERLFDHASDQFIKQHTNTKLTGIKEATLEFNYLKVHLLIVYRAITDRVLELPQRFAKSPVSLLSEVATLLLILFLFRFFRKSMSTALPQLQKKILSNRTQSRVQAARFIWYVDQTRAPIEWLLLVNVLLTQLDLLQMPLLDQVIWTLTYWLCFTLFTFKLLSKVIARGRQAITKDISSKQISALKLAVFWFGLFMASKALTLLFINAGAIYAWLVSGLIIVALPIYLFFIMQWKNNAFLFINTERDASPWAVKLAQKNTGLRGFIHANICLIYCIYFALSKAFLQLISRLESGRRLTTELYRNRLIKDNEEFLASLSEQEKLSTEQVKALVQDKSYINEDVFVYAFEKVDKMLAMNERSHLAIIGERGIGKTTFLTSLASKYPNQLLINCSASFDDIYLQFTQQLGLAIEEAKNDDILQALKAQNITLILLDNFHYLASPNAGGQRNIKRLLGFINDLKEQALWVMSFESKAWQLMSALSISPGFFTHQIRLPAWSEAHISQLLSTRSENTGIMPTYEHLFIPRQIVDIDEEDLTDRNRSGIYRIIWGYAEGNPAIAIRVYSEAIIKQQDNYYATLPISPDTKLIEGLDINTLLLLRVILQFGRANTNEIINNLRLNGLMINGALAACLAQGFIEKTDGGYQISWHWFRAISKFLDRQNLLSH